MDWAVIFDWDGVVVDSSEAHRKSWEQLASEENLVLPPDHMRNGFGKKNTTIIPDILEWTDNPGEIRRLSDRKEAIYRDFLAAGDATLLPGSRELLQELAREKVTCVVGSSTDRQNIEQAIQQFELKGFFTDIASAEDCDAGKPAPDIFLAAARKAGINPAACLVLEDAPHGVEAAHRAGMKAVGLLTSNPEAAMSASDRVVRDLSHLTVAILHDILNA